MKLVMMSDTHNRHDDIEVPDGDVLIHAGDATGRGSTEEVLDFLNWFSSLPHKHKIFIAGNHDWYFERTEGLGKITCEERGIIYLEDSGVTIDGVKFWGSPVTPQFMDWAFNRARNEAEFNYCHGRYPLIKPHWDLIPNDTDVLITHGPPYDILDEVLSVCGDPTGRFVGCEELKKAVDRVKPKLHIFGHIHCGFGERIVNGTHFFNVAMLDEMYYPDNKPVVYELEIG